MTVGGWRMPGCLPRVEVGGGLAWPRVSMLL